MHAIQGDEALRSQFALDVLLFSIEMLVFMNQTGTDCRDCIRRRGYSYIVLNRKKNLYLTFDISDIASNRRTWRKFSVYVQYIFRL